MQIPFFFFCLTATFTNQILNQEPEFSFKPGKIGITGIFCLDMLQLHCCFQPRAGAGCSCPLLPALLSLYPGNFVFPGAAFPGVFFWEWEDNPVDRLCKKCFFAGFGCDQWFPTRARLLSPALDIPNLCLDFGNVWRIFQILPGLGARLASCGWCRGLTGFLLFLILLSSSGEVGENPVLMLG